MTDTFSGWVRSYVYDAQNGFCKLCYARIEDFHHRLPNTVTNRSKYPLFLQSPFNCVGLCRDCHSGPKKNRFKVSDAEAEVYESWLMRLSVGSLME